MTKYSFLVLFFLTLLSCKKEQIEPEVPTNEIPVFTINGNIDGTPINFEAGVNGAYLSTYTLLNAGVERFSGRILQGQNYAEFGLYNGNLLLPSSNIAQAGTKIRLTSLANVPLLELNKDLFYNSGNIAYIDIKLNGKSHGESVTIFEPGIYEICVEVHFLDSQQSVGTTCNTLILGYMDYGTCKIEQSVSGAGQIQASLISATSIANVNWFVDNVFVSSGVNFAGEMVENGHLLRADVTFSNGVNIRREVFVNTYDENVFIEDLSNFKLPIAQALLRDFKADFSIFLNGVLYTHLSVGAEPEVIITGLSYYGINSNGKDVYKLTGTINTQMKNNTTMSEVNAQFNVAIGIEIP